ncbi:hypothetical protein [Neobacillus sp.]|uniref:hypothetical protein n=1 Tax=Neobacillus sp. TaxID=2675273 RepID=UPI00289FA0E5|nr:hypothetical protein [Neobacillus sp.]
MKTKYICQLPDEIRENIYDEVQNALSKIGLSDSELVEAIEAAMNSRLCDLEDTIDISKYLVV